MDKNSENSFVNYKNSEMLTYTPVICIRFGQFKHSPAQNACHTSLTSYIYYVSIITLSSGSETSLENHRFVHEKKELA